AGGQFASIGGLARNNLAALDTTTGRASGWNPDPNGDVNALAISGSTIYAGGTFTSIGGQPRNQIAALDANTARATPWAANANPWVACEWCAQTFGVTALAIAGSTLYVGGYFTSIGGQPRNHLAALQTTTGNATA